MLYRLILQNYKSFRDWTEFSMMAPALITKCGSHPKERD